jgi:alkylation response protein AidB-like acyl-CoA dehydrogenase
VREPRRLRLAAVGAEVQDDVPRWAHPILAAAATVGEDVPLAVRVARDCGAQLPLPGKDTAARWSVLAAVSAINLTLGRILEAHSDALAILAEAGQTPDTASVWGVFAAEAPSARLEAGAVDDAGSTTLSGVKPWCSIAADLDEALVTAHTANGRQLFRVDLRHASVTPEPAQQWVARGLRTVTSAPVNFDGTPAVAVGAPGWYLTRPGFAWGGIGVAACWYGGAVGLADGVRRRAKKSTADLDLMHLGTVDVALHSARCALDAAAAAIDAGAADRSQGEILALRTRTVVADAVERVLVTVAHALGPAPLAFDADHAARVADLELYIRQHHAERDLVALGTALLERAR